MRGIITVSASVERENTRDAMVTLVIRVEILLHTVMAMDIVMIMAMVKIVFMVMIVIVIVNIAMALRETTGHLEKVIVHADMEIGRKASASRIPLGKHIP